MKDTITASPEILYSFLTTVYGEATAVRIFKMNGMTIPSDSDSGHNRPIAA